MDSQNLGGLIIFQNVRWSGPFLRLLRNVLIILQYYENNVIQTYFYQYMLDSIPWDISKIQLAIAVDRSRRVSIACELHVGNSYMQKIAKQQLRREFRKYCAQKWRHKILQTSSFLFYCTGLQNYLSMGSIRMTAWIQAMIMIHSFIGVCQFLDFLNLKTQFVT